MWIVILGGVIMLPLVLIWKFLIPQDGPFEIKQQGYKKGMAKGNYKNRVLHGRWVEYYPTGKVKIEGQYRKGKKEDKWTEYYPSGKIMKRVEFFNDEKSGRYVVYDEKGKVISEENIQAVKKETEKKIETVKGEEKKEPAGNNKIISKDDRKDIPDFVKRAEKTLDDLLIKFQKENNSKIIKDTLNAGGKKFSALWDEIMGK